MVQKSTLRIAFSRLFQVHLIRSRFSHFESRIDLEILLHLGRGNVLNGRPEIQGMVCCSPMQGSPSLGEIIAMDAQLGRDHRKVDQTRVHTVTYTCGQSGCSAWLFNTYPSLARIWDCHANCWDENDQDSWDDRPCSKKRMGGRVWIWLFIRSDGLEQVLIHRKNPKNHSWLLTTALVK